MGSRVWPVRWKNWGEGQVRWGLRDTRSGLKGSKATTSSCDTLCELVKGTALLRNICWKLSP